MALTLIIPSCVTLFTLIVVPLPASFSPSISHVSQSGLYTWRHVKDPTIIMTDLSSAPWKAKSLMRCILECASRIPDCNSVRYHRKLRSCQAGFALFRSQNNFAVSSNSLITADEVLYSKTLNVCDANFDFTLQYSSGFISCIRTALNRLDYTAATQDCRQNGGGRVFALRDENRLTHLSGLTNSVYIGLGKTQDGSYNWTDGTKLVKGSRAWTGLWAVGEPDISGTTLCVILARDYKMYTVGCGKPYGFVCELPVV